MRQESNSSLFTLFILLVFMIGAAVTAFLWIVNATGEQGEATFASLLAIDLMCFAIILYAYRVGRAGKPPRVVWLAAGTASLALIIAVRLFV